jgi:hypothetical protein
MRTISEYSKDELTDLYNQYKTLSKISKNIGLSIESIRKKFIELEIPYKKQVVYDVNHKFFNTITEKSAYWLGFISADGNVAQNKPRISIMLKKTEYQHLIKFKNDLDCQAPIYTGSRKDNRKNFKSKIYYFCKIRFTSKKIKNDLASLGILPRKSKILTFPEILKNHPLVNHYIRGLIDGDGSIDVINNCGGIYLCGTYDIVNETKKIIDRDLNLTGTKLRFNKSNGLYFFKYIRHKEVCKIINYLYNSASTWLDRKKESADQILGLEKNLKIDIDLDLLKTIKPKELAKQLGVSEITIWRRRRENKIVSD